MLYAHYCLFINRLMIFDEGKYCIANHTIAAIEALKWDDVRYLIRYQMKVKEISLPDRTCRTGAESCNNYQVGNQDDN